MPERHPPDDPREWLNRARSDLLLAKSYEEGIYLEDLCFHAQQAVLGNWGLPLTFDKSFLKFSGFF